MKNDESSEDELRDVVTLIENMACPRAKIISEIEQIRKRHITLGVVSLMAKAYLLGLHDGKIHRK